MTEKIKKMWYQQASTWAGISTIVGAIGAAAQGVCEPATAIMVSVAGLMSVLYPEKKKIK